MSEQTAQTHVMIADVQTLIEQAADFFVQAARAAIERRGMFHVALSGGNTPRPLYEHLASPPHYDEVEWTKVQVFFSDERFVPADSPESNFRMAREALLSKVPIPERFIHRVATEDMSPEEAAANYEEGLRRVFAVGLDEDPHFDLILLGLGSDGHTASLFPGTDALTVNDRLVAANYVPRMDTWRVTFTYRLLDAALNVAFLVQGEDKAPVVRRVLAGGSDLPAGRVQTTIGQTVWLLDRVAASELEASTPRVETMPQPILDLPPSGVGARPVSDPRSDGA